MAELIMVGDSRRLFVREVLSKDDWIRREGNIAAVDARSLRPHGLEIASQEVTMSKISLADRSFKGCRKGVDYPLNRPETPQSRY